MSRFSIRRYFKTPTQWMVTGLGMVGTFWLFGIPFMYGAFDDVLVLRELLRYLFIASLGVAPLGFVFILIGLIKLLVAKFKKVS